MSTAITYINRPTGRIAYDLIGDGPLVICLPGMGDVRSVYRFLAQALAEAGFRIATMDLRGHGDSDATFDVYDDVAAGTDLISLAEHLGGPAVLIGNSMGAGAACWAAAEARWIADRLNGEVLIVPGAGHYPQAEFPEVVSPAVVEFVRRITLPVAAIHSIGRE